ncbi:MAG: hydantoinase/oxoprolinase family protein [Proteobacteria bacterium]|nr:hydantoinase/oxoprolinase family protein [Pseudomonadota bacterium]
MRVATDVGGTFTDLVYYDYDEETGTFGGIKTEKVETTPPNFEQGVMDTIHKAGLAPKSISFFAHGTTVVINALLARKGAKTGLITTKGFRDVLEIARGNRPDLFNFYFTKPKPFVPRYLRKEVDERVNYKGEILTQADLSGLPAIIEEFRDEGVEAIAISFLHAYANPENEIAVLGEIRRLWNDVSVVASHRITREWREYERTSTAVLSAYVHPLANRYLKSLDAKLRSDGFSGTPFIMQSNGGIATLNAAAANPITMVESGPSSGVLGAIELGKLIGEPNMITLDIGGTTAKCALVEDSRARITTDYKIEWTRTNPGYPIKTPVIEIVEIGNGGGSIAWIDEGGKLHVGPQSAGAMPGPAAYGRGGTEPTTTDAHLITGRIDPDYFLGGEIEPDMENLDKVFQALATKLKVSVKEAARGVIRIANANMVNALKLVSINKGYDPREFVLVAFGGGGAMHAVALAEELQVPKVIVPVNSAVFSAWGMLVTDLRRDYIRTKLVRLADVDPADVGRLFDEMAEAATAEYEADGVDAGRLMFQRYGDMRYQGQEHSVKIEFPDGAVGEKAVAEAIRRFHEAHEREYTFRLENPVELVNYHLVVSGRVAKPDLSKLESTGRALKDTVRGVRSVDFDESGIHETTIYERGLLEPGMVLEGPCVIEEPAATLLVTPGKRVEIDDYGNIHIIMKS